MRSVLFAGCSYTAGSGWPQDKLDPNLWVNLLHQNTKLNEYHMINCAQGGRSNSGIFADAVYNLTHNDCEYAFVAWTSSPRYQMQLGCEVYDTCCWFIPNSRIFDYNLNNINYTSSYLENIRDRFTTLAHLYGEILPVVSYVNSLTRLAKLTKTKIFFINGLCEWDNQYFIRLENVLPNQYTKFTKKLIDVDNRDNDEIFKIYSKIHNEYDQLGGIQESHWINLYNSMWSQMIDTNPDLAHPGIKSNQLYFQQISQHIR
jgi:hypothetical protein